MAASKTYSVQAALNTCPDHQHEEIEMYCKTCGKPVCTKCVKGNHNGHDWDTLVKMAKVLRKQTSQKKLEIESVSKSILVGIEEVLTSLTSGAESEMILNCSELDSKRKTIVEFVNKSFEDKKSKCKTNHKSKMEHIRKRREQLEARGRRMNFLIQNMETGAKDFSDYDLIELHDELRRILNELQDLAVMPHGLHDRMFYRPGSSDKASLETLVGSVVEVKQSASEVKLEQEFKIGDTTINSIHPLSENEAWVHLTQTNINHLVDISGKIKRSVDLGCLIYNFALTEDGAMYFCDTDTHTAKWIDKHGNINSLFSTSPLFPICISVTRSGDLLITLVDENINSRNISSRRLVRRLSMTGEVIMEYEFDNDGITPLFCRPINPLEHFNGNICVVNVYRNDADIFQGTIIGLDSKSKVLFKYNGIDDNFNPMDISCDLENNTLVSDAGNKRIHIIDPNGKFVRYLLTQESFADKIYAVALSDNKLWIGSRGTGLLKVFKFDTVK